MPVRSLSILLAALLAGCATSPARFERMMDGYLGAPLEEVQRLFGYNDIRRDLPDGRRAHTWVWAERGVSPGYQTPSTIQTYRSGDTTRTVIHPGTFFPPRQYEALCEFSFIVDAAQRVRAWRAHGNGCADFPGPGPVLGGALPGG